MQPNSTRQHTHAKIQVAHDQSPYVIKHQRCKSSIMHANCPKVVYENEFYVDKHPCTQNTKLSMLNMHNQPPTNDHLTYPKASKMSQNGRKGAKLDKRGTESLNTYLMVSDFMQDPRSVQKH